MIQQLYTQSQNALLNLSQSSAQKKSSSSLWCNGLFWIREKSLFDCCSGGYRLTKGFENFLGLGVPNVFHTVPKHGSQGVSQSFVLFTMISKYIDMWKERMGKYGECFVECQKLITFSCNGLKRKAIIMKKIEICFCLQLTVTNHSTLLK